MTKPAEAMTLREKVALAIRKADDAGNLLDSEIADAAIAEVASFATQQINNYRRGGMTCPELEMFRNDLLRAAREAAKG